MIRLFVAIAVPEETAGALAPLASGVPGAHWSPPENLHITLRFAGEVTEGQADDLDAALGAIVTSPFDVSLGGVGAFGDENGIHALWAGVEPGEPLARLRRRCAVGCSHSWSGAGCSWWAGRGDPRASRRA